MNYPLIINEESVLLNILSDIPYQGIHEHGITKNIHNNFRTVKRLKPESRNDGLYRFTLPEEGFLEGIVFNITISSAIINGTFIEERAGCRVFENIFLKQGSKELCKINPSYILARINQEPVQKQKNYFELTTFNEIPNENTINCIVPFFSSFTDNSHNNLLLSYFKRLEIHAFFNQDLITDWLITNIDIDCSVFIKNYEPEYYNSFIYKEFSLTKFKNYFSYDIFTIKQPLDIGSTYTKIPLQGPYLVFAIHSIIFNSNWSNVPINRIQLQCSGFTVLDITTQENALLEPSFYQYNGNSFSYFFGSKSRDHHSGAININTGPWTLTVFHNQIGEAGNIYIDLEYFCILRSDQKGVFEKNLIF